MRDTTTPQGWVKEDGTDEGRLIRLHREALTPKVRQQDLAARLGWSRDKIARTENGYGRARDDAGPTRYPCDDTDLARVAAELCAMAAGYGTPDLGVAPEELDSIGRGGAAELLRGLLAVPQPGVQDPRLAPAVERLLAALGRDDEFVRFLAADTGADGDARALAERTLAVASWVEGHPAGAAEGVRRTG
jgi:hypothetical protein